MSRTNEELTLCIQNGETDLYPELWEQVYKLLYLLANRYYSLHSVSCDRAGVTEDDLKQNCYFVMTEAVSAYRIDAGYSLSAYFALQCRRIFGAACGLRRRDPLNDCASLDKPLDASDQEGDTLSDIIANDQNVADDVTEKLYFKQLRVALNQALILLPETERECVTAYYLQGKTYDTVAQAQGITRDEAHRYIDRGMKQLRRGKPLTLLRGVASDIIDRYAYSSSLEKWRQTGTSSTEYTALKLLDAENLKHE